MVGYNSKKRMGRKGQAATEYIHTYGWVILTMVLIGGAMLYYNVSNAKPLVPLECRFLSGINCLDADVDQNLLSLVLLNEFGFTIGNITMNITGTCDSIANTTDGNPYGNLNVLLTNQQSRYVLECQNISNMRLTERITIAYRNVDTDQLHIKTGKLEYSPTGG
jgi:hypothetical protein